MECNRSTIYSEETHNIETSKKHNSKEKTNKRET